MRTIEREIYNVAISMDKNGERRLSERDRVWREGNIVVIFLHTTKIAQIEDGKMQLFARGWRSTTTKSRLNSLLQNTKSDWRIFQEKFEWKVRNLKTGETKEFDDGIEFAIA